MKFIERVLIIILVFGTISTTIARAEMMLDSSFDADFYADLAEFSCLDNFCNIQDLIGPPPDLILDLPPPPIPSFLNEFNNHNNILSNDSEKCNLCNQLVTSTVNDGLSFILPKQQATISSGFNILLMNNSSLIISIILSILSVFFLIALYIKYKKMKISMIDTCSSLFSQKNNFFSKSTTTKDSHLQVNSSRGGCRTTLDVPVVNEKTVQSIITNCSPSKKSTIIPAKYWSAANIVGQTNTTLNSLNGLMNLNEYNTTEMSDYGLIPDDMILTENGSGCTSSPVYAELDGSSNPHHHLYMSNLITLNNLNNSATLTNQQRYKSYTMRNQQQNTTIDTSSYDNESYLPSSNSDYHNKSFTNHRGQMVIGSKTPLLSNTLIQHNHHGRINNTLMPNSNLSDDFHQNTTLTLQPRYVQQQQPGNKKNILIYNGQPILSSNSSSNFTQTRPLPKLPNNFI